MSYAFLVFLAFLTFLPFLAFLTFLTIRSIRQIIHCCHQCIECVLLYHSQLVTWLVGLKCFLLLHPIHVTQQLLPKPTVLLQCVIAHVAAEWHGWLLGGHLPIHLE